MDIYYLALYFYVYGFLGWCSEVGYAALKEHRFVNRGFLSGPICPIYGAGVSVVLAFLTPLRSNVVLLYVISVILVTTLEGLTGWAMDKIFHHKWWDYSGMPFNIGGYVCLPFSILWGVVCVAIVDFINFPIHEMLVYLPHILGLILLTGFSVLLLADTCVTASAIFKFNRHMAHMEKIAAELHEISDKIGRDIYEQTIQAIERQEKLQETLDKTGIPQETREHIAELYTRYNAMKQRRHAVYERLLQAFPGMESRNHREIFRELRRHIREQIREKGINK